MDNFKKVLEIESKYNHQINLAKKKLGLKKEQCIKDLKLKDEVIKKDFENELKKDLKIKENNYIKTANEITNNSRNLSERIKNDANINLAIKFILEELKNV